MRQRIHLGSMILGSIVGVGATLLIAAAAKPAAPQAVATPPASASSAGRYQIVSAAREGFTNAYVVDSVTGKVAIVPENGSASVVAPQWGDQ